MPINVTLQSTWSTVQEMQCGVSVGHVLKAGEEIREGKEGDSKRKGRQEREWGCSGGQSPGVL